VKSYILTVLVLSHVVFAKTLVLDDHFTDGVVLDNDGIGGDWVVVQQDSPWTPHGESGTEVTVYDGGLSWAICRLQNLDTYTVGMTARVTVTGIEYSSGSSRCDRGNGVQAAISAQVTVSDYTNISGFPSGYQNDGKAALNCEINYDPNTERIGFCLMYSNLSSGSGTLYAAEPFDASAAQLGVSNPLIIEMTPLPDSTCIVRFNWSYDGGKTEALSVPMSNNGTPLTDGLFMVLVGAQGVVECNGSVKYDRVEVIGRTLWVDAANAGDVDADGSAEHPFWLIQDGIDAAVRGDEVVVRDGTYRGAGNTNLNFRGRLITLGSENGSDNCIIACQGAQAFTFENGETGDAVVDGFAVQGGHGFLGVMYVAGSPTIIGCRFIEGSSIVGGGGVFLSNSYSRIQDCEFIANTSMGDGGAVYAALGGASIINCLFTENSSGNGGALSADSASVTVSGCKFLSNRSSGMSSLGGGAVDCYRSDITLTDSVFSGDYYEYDGGAVCCRASSLKAVGCRFVGNRADHYGLTDGRGGGGGIFVKDLDGTQQVIIDDCIFSGNYAKTAGGGICAVACSNLSVANSLFAGNGCEDLFGAGAITTRDQADIVVRNCTFADNWGSYGGVYGWPVVASLSNCILWNPGVEEASAASIIYSNVREGTAGEGNIDCDPCFSVNMSGTWASDASYDGNAYTVTCTDENASWQENELAGLFIYPGGDPRLVLPIIANTAMTVTSYADAKTNMEGASGIKAGWSYTIRDYHVTPESPCVDKGNPNYVSGPNETDVEKMPRVVNGDCADSTRIDMGAYEFSYAWAGDFNGNCRVDILDFGLIASAWVAEAGASTFDHLFDISVPADERIDAGDLTILAEHWLDEMK